MTRMDLSFLVEVERFIGSSWLKGTVIVCPSRFGMGTPRCLMYSKATLLLNIEDLACTVSLDLDSVQCLIHGLIMYLITYVTMFICMCV